jgi:hypothetical protein
MIDVVDWWINNWDVQICWFECIRAYVRLLGFVIWYGFGMYTMLGGFK